MIIDLSKTFLDINKNIIGQEEQYLVAEKTKNGIKPLTGENGRPLIAKLTDQDAKPLTLKKVCEVSLLVDQEGEKISSDEKIKRASLGFRILHGGDKQNFSMDEIVYLKALIYQKNPTLIAGQADAHFEKQAK